MSLLEITNLSHYFGDVQALDGLSLSVERGEFVVIVGASGCGKSTLLNLVAGFLAPSEGKVVLDGAPVVGVEPRCGMVFQKYALFPWLSVRENIGFGPKMQGKSTTHIDDLMRLVQIEDFADSWPKELSGGMQQRVALARALANQPEVLLCDEPFAALDAMTRQVLQEELASIAKEQGTTVLFITHSIDEALLMADRIIVMSARPGRVKTSLNNDLPRPRNADLQITPRYGALKSEIWESVQEEVMAAMAAQKGRAK